MSNVVYNSTSFAIPIDWLMETKSPHITEVFKRFAVVQQQRLQGCASMYLGPVHDLLSQILSHLPCDREAPLLSRALLDPYFPLGILDRTLFADVEGMRFFINKRRADLEPVIVGELIEWTATFFKIRSDIRISFDPATITCIPLDGNRHQLPENQWCTLCGVCCQIGGISPEPPPGIQYPTHWYTYLSGKAAENQQFCPFLFQYFGEARFFCAIHNIKPMPCREFEEADCRRRLGERRLHRYHVDLQGARHKV